MTLRLVLSIACFAAVLSSPPLAAGERFGHAQVAFDSVQFEAQRERILKDLRDGERYSEIDQDQLVQVKAALDRLGNALSGKTALDQLDERTKVAVFNDQELVNTVLTGVADDSRLICRRETPTGSHRPTNICMSVAERRAAQESAKDLMRRSNGMGGAEVPATAGR